MVGDTKISESQVDDTIAACEEAGAPLLGETAAGNRGSIVFSMAAGEVARKGGAHKDYVPSQEELDAELATLPPAVLDAPDCKAYFDGTLRFNAAFAAMQQQAPDQIEAALDDAVKRIKLNPKYGRFKPGQDGAMEMTSGSMSTAVNPALIDS